MACLYFKHFGDKVFLNDLNSRIVNEMLDIPRKDKKNKIPNFGILVRFDDDMVGLTVQWFDSKGHSNYSYEQTRHNTIHSWAKFHTDSKMYS